MSAGEGEREGEGKGEDKDVHVRVRGRGYVGAWVHMRVSCLWRFHVEALELLLGLDHSAAEGILGGEREGGGRCKWTVINFLLSPHLALTPPKHTPTH